TAEGDVTPAEEDYDLAGTHTNLDEGTYPIPVTVTGGGASATFGTTATLLEEFLFDGTRGTPNQRFIFEVYRDLLHRHVEAGGLAFWAGLLDRGVSRTEVVQRIESCGTME